MIACKYFRQSGFIFAECDFQKFGWTAPFLEIRPSLQKKVFLTPKKVKIGAKKKDFLRIHVDRDGMQKTGSKMVKFGLCNSISDLQTPIGGSHPMLYFPSKSTKKYSMLPC